MLALKGSNPLGNVLHLISGPETEIFVDIHGAAIMDITPVLSEMDGDRRVFLSLTRCRYEPITEQMIKATGAAVTSSFNSKGEGAPVGDMQAPPPSTGKKATSKPKLETCTYCDSKAELLPIPGFAICTACAQIEIGRATKPAPKRRKKKDTPSANGEEHTG